FQAVLNGVNELLDRGVAPQDISFFSHGTTVGTNTLLEEKGAKIGLLVTQGFRGIYEVMEQTRGYGPATYDLFFEKPRLLAPPYYTEEIPERVDFRGQALKPIDVEASLQAVRRLKKKGVQSVAVCFLFSFLNPDHELKIKEIFAKEFPEASLSLSCEVALIHQGSPVITTQGKINQRPISLPMLDIHTVSARGGTIARIDAVGALQVGPDSAGADPGPVCYDRGGENITITDANVVTG